MVKKEQIAEPRTIEPQLPSGGCGVPAIDRYGREWAAKLRELESAMLALGVSNVDPNNDRQVWDYVYNVLQLEPIGDDTGAVYDIPAGADIPAELVSVSTLSRLSCRCSQLDSDKLREFRYLMVEHKTFREWLDTYGQFEDAVLYYRQSMNECRRMPGP